MKKILYLFLLLYIIVPAQNAADYFPAQTGHVWKYRITPLDSLNKPMDSLSYYQIDSFALSQNYFGKSANFVVSKTGPAATIFLQPYLDTSYISFSGSNAFTYFQFTDLDTLIAFFDSSIVSLGHSFEAWYNNYKFAQSVNSNYTVFSFDTTVTIDSTVIPLRFEISGKRLNDQTLNTAIGTFNCKKFIGSNKISYLLKLPAPLPPIAVKIVEFIDTVYIAPNNWIVKSVAPSTTIDLSLLQLGSYTLPGEQTEAILNIVDLNDPVITFPNSINLEQNYPNPFNPSTAIRFSLDNSYDVDLSIYDILGNKVANVMNGKLGAGNYEYPFNAGSLTSGVYFYCLKAGNSSVTKKLLLIK